jgi:DNA-binding NarL/FixJ family response regulator
MSIENSLRVLVVDDHAAIRRGIASLINSEWPYMRCVGAVATLQEALGQAAEHRPDVVVLDADLDGEDGLSLIPPLRRAADCAVVVLTSLLDPRITTRAHDLGAAACLHKAAPASELIACVAISRSLSSGNHALPRDCREQSALPRRGPSAHTKGS